MLFVVVFNVIFACVLVSCYKIQVSIWGKENV